MTDLSKLAARAQDAPEPIKRTVTRTAKDNPVQPILAESWEHRTKRNGSDAEVGATKQIRTYSGDETLALVRALRRASDVLNVGVRIDAPSDEVEEDGKTKTRYRAGNVRFEAVTRQKRARKNGTEQAEPEQAEQAESEQDSEQASEQAEPEPQPEPEPAWQ